MLEYKQMIQKAISCDNTGTGGAGQYSATGGTGFDMLVKIYLCRDLSLQLIAIIINPTCIKRRPHKTPQRQPRLPAFVLQENHHAHHRSVFLPTPSRQDLQRLSQSFGQLRLELDTVCRELSGEATRDPPTTPPCCRLAARLSAADKTRLALLRGLAVITRLAGHAALSLASAVRRGVACEKNRHSRAGGQSRF